MSLFALRLTLFIIHYYSYIIRNEVALQSLMWIRQLCVPTPVIDTVYNKSCYTKLSHLI